MLSQVVELIEKKDRFAITSHVRPDGDGLGSSLGLFWLLKSLNKDVEVIMRDPAPHSYRQLPGAGTIRVAPRIGEHFDAVKQTIESDPRLTLEAKRETRFYADQSEALATFINYLGTTISVIFSIGAIIGAMITMYASVASRTAECVYTALLTDTGSFHYSNTTERTFKIASELVRTGVRPAKTAEALFGSYQWPKIELLGQVLATAKRDETGHVAWMWQTLAMQEQTHAAEEDADGFVNYPLAVAEVEATALFKETAPGVYRTSLRSKGDVNVAKIAEQFGGGGHRNAAGCTLKGTSSELEQRVVPLLQDAVKRSNGLSDLTEDALK